MLTEEAEVVTAPDRSEATVAAMIRDFDAVITRTTKINREIIERGKRLRVIGCHSAGYDNVDLRCATDHGVCVVHTPGANTRSVAELVVGLMLASTRLLIKADYAQRVERDYSKRHQLMGHDLGGKTVGIIGMGRIGKKLARICIAGFDMKVIGYSPSAIEKDLREIGVTKVDDVYTIFKESDFVSLNCSLSKKVQGLVNRETLRLMKPSAFLINCARGPIIDEAALCEALKAGVIAGAALDVFDTEPTPKNNPLLDAPNLIAAPHIGTLTYESMDSMAEAVAAGVLDVLRGEKSRLLVNPEVWDKRRGIF
ncbi:Hydroxypyruvate reductase [Sporomusa acidovorans DSM 3132]|uniref:Hydroxypyruvate reductase n=2 Tax=Sporomusa TaxID=2375 RepID=A0ABZ3IXT3_SPOA4|nr:hydroxypyruvate reductase [Sporomusa acidovorans DSM 3132]SDF51356.1 D-3-phosphoglycerate dehydrogenase [Sporomusa acidovorans]